MRPELATEDFELPEKNLVVFFLALSVVALVASPSLSLSLPHRGTFQVHISLLPSPYSIFYLTFPSNQIEQSKKVLQHIYQVS